MKQPDEDDLVAAGIEGRVEEDEVEEDQDTSKPDLPTCDCFDFPQGKFSTPACIRYVPILTLHFLP